MKREYIKGTIIKRAVLLILCMIISVFFAGCSAVSDLSEDTINELNETANSYVNAQTEIAEVMDLFNQRPTDTIPKADVLIQAGEKQTINSAGYGFEGTIEVTLINSGIYNSFNDIPNSYDLGLLFREKPPNLYEERGGKLAVFTLEVHNIDASSLVDYNGDYEVFMESIFSLKEDEFQSVLASFSDPLVWDTNSKFSSYFELHPGETKLITIAHWFSWVPVKKPPEHVVLTVGLNGKYQFDLTPNGWDSNSQKDTTALIQTGQKQEIYSSGAGYTGTIDITVLDSGIFNSIEEAQKHYDLGTILQRKPPELYRESEAKLAVFILEIHNIDATTFRTTLSQAPAFTTNIFRIKKDIQTGLAVASLSDLAEGINESQPYFSVDLGETKCITISCWFAGDSLDKKSDHVVLVVGKDNSYQFDLTPDGWN